MQAIPRPSIGDDEAFAECISRTRGELRQKYLSAAPEASAASVKYVSSAQVGSISALRVNNFKSKHVTSKQLEGLYESRMVDKTGPARWIYDEIKLAVEICPLCRQRVVGSLDHFLPKSKYPLLSVAPSNLVPVCVDCNYLKLDVASADEALVPLNPYFDDLGDDPWLHATVVESAPCSVTFRVAPPGSWTSALAARVSNHFSVLKLAKLYTVHAGVEVRQIGGALGRAFERAGAAGVREHLEDQVFSRHLRDANTWSAALYSSLLQSDWYCEGGFSYA